MGKQFTLKGLEKVNQLSETDRVVVNTSQGVKELNADILGKVFANTSLFESYQMLLNEEVHSRFLTTNNKIKKYLAEDTSDEIYVDVKNGVITVNLATVHYNASGKPLKTQAIDSDGNLLYWSDDPENSVVYDEKFPWKTEEGKIYIYPATPEFKASSYPVMTYIYDTTVVFEISPNFDNSKKPCITFDIGQTGDKVNITKSNETFSVIYGTEETTKCGFTINKVNEVGLAKLYGIWDGINTYSVTSSAHSINTLNKALLYLTSDTSNQVFITIKGSEVLFYSAVTSGDFSSLTDDFGKPLYWTDKISEITNKAPLNSLGEEVHLTTIPTKFPAYEFEYSTTLIGSVSYDMIQNSLTIEQSSENSNSLISLTPSELSIHYENGSDFSDVILKGSEGVLKGNWTVTPQQGDTFALKDTYDKSEVYTKTEVYSKDEVYSKAEVYSKQDVYTKQEVENLIDALRKELSPSEE